jgi:hypothetical protein
MVKYIALSIFASVIISLYVCFDINKEKNRQIDIERTYAIQKLKDEVEIRNLKSKLGSCIAERNINTGELKITYINANKKYKKKR